MSPPVAATGAARSTELASRRRAGRAATLRLDLLEDLLRGPPRVKSKDVLVGHGPRDAAAVFRLSSALAVVEAVGTFPPLVDDPFAFGQIAAAAAMSDVWAMGARPLLALHLVAVSEEQPLAALEAIFAGGADKAAEAGVPVLGGHPIPSAEPRYGMAVTGVVHPRRVLTNARAEVGDRLVLTKPLGTGIATTALQRKLASASLVKQVTAQMATLNRAAGQVFASGRFPVHALTGVGGAGLLGQAIELARGATKHLVLHLEEVPILAGVAALSEAGVVPRGTKTNLEQAQRWTRFPEGLPEPVRHVLSDVQTNGGLLAAIPARALPKALAALHRAKVDGWVVGEVRRGRPGVTVA